MWREAAVERRNENELKILDQGDSRLDPMKKSSDLARSGASKVESQARP